MTSSSEQRTHLDVLERHGDAVRGLLRRLCGNESDANDLFQETAVKVLQNIATLEHLQNPQSWLMMVAYRTFLDQRKRKRPVTIECETPDRRASDPLFQAQRSEERESVRAAIESLPEHLREVLVLHYTGELSLQQTADAMQLALGTVKSRLNQALLTLRKQLT